MKIKQHQYELRSWNRLRLHNSIILSHKKSNLMVTEHCCNVKHRSCKRPEEVTSSKKSDIKLRNSKIHKRNIKSMERNKERPKTGSVTNNQNTKRMFINGQNEKENVSDYKVAQKHKGIMPCRVLISDCLSKKENRKNPWNKPESIYKTDKQADKLLNVYLKTDYIHSQASQCHEADPDMPAMSMSNVSRQFIHKNNSGNNFVSRISYQNQISQRTVVSKEITSQFCSDISDDISRMYILDSARRSALNENMHRTRFVFIKQVYFKSVRKWLSSTLWLWICLSFLLPLFILDYWNIMKCSLLSPIVYNMSKNMTNKSLSALKIDSNENREAEEELIDSNTLVNKIVTIEKEQRYLKEYLMNITCILKDYKRKQADLKQKYKDEDTDLLIKLNISELNSVVSSELKMIKHELEELRNLSVELTFFINNYTTTQIDKILSDYFPSKISKKGLTENVLMSRNGGGQTVSNDNASDSNAHISEERVRKIVKEILQIYDADKTSQVDYALESAGGELISIRDTQEYVRSEAVSILGFPLYHRNYRIEPQTVIQRNAMQPGVCWAFQKFPGYLLIRLRSVIYVTGFTLEHVPKLIEPAGNISSAPRNFKVWGLTDMHDSKPVMFGDYEFVYFEDNLQYFPVQNTEIKKPYEYVELRIHSNHGQQDYTCLYRFRVHGRST